MHALLSDDAWHGLEWFAAEHSLTVTALVEALGRFLHPDPPNFTKRNERWVIDLARQIDRERRQRRR